MLPLRSKLLQCRPPPPLLGVPTRRKPPQPAQPKSDRLRKHTPSHTCGVRQSAGSTNRPPCPLPPAPTRPFLLALASVILLRRAVRWLCLYTVSTRAMDLRTTLIFESLLGAPPVTWRTHARVADRQHRSRTYGPVAARMPFMVMPIPPSGHVALRWPDETAPLVEGSRPSSSPLCETHPLHRQGCSRPQRLPAELRDPKEAPDRFASKLRWLTRSMEHCAYACSP